jgi:hypothetical protein
VHLTSSSPLTGEDFHCWRATFRPDTENVPRCIYITIMRASATRADPVPYSKTCDTFWATNCTTVGTGLGRQSLADFNIARSVPAGLVAELATQHRPTHVEDGFRHLRLGEHGRADIANDDQFIFSSNFCTLLVKVMSAGVCNFGVDCPHTFFVFGALSYSKLRLVSAVMMERRNDCTVAACRQGFQPKIDTNFAFARSQFFGNLALETDIPAAASILYKTTRFEDSREIARLPKTEFSLEIRDLAPIDANSTRKKRYPAKSTLGTLAGPPSQVSFVGVPAGNIFPANRLNGVRVNSKLRRRSSAKPNKIKSCWPNSRPSALPASFSFTLDLIAVIPYSVHSPRVSVEVFVNPCVFDPVLKRQHHRKRIGCMNLAGKAYALFRDLELASHKPEPSWRRP